MVEQQTVMEFLSALASRTSTPGGGAVAALTGAQAAGLVAMVGEFSDKTLDDKNRTQLLNESKAAMEKFLELADEDAAAFAELMACYKRKAGVQAALQNAAQAPLKCLDLANSLVPLVKVLDQAGNPNLVTDTGIAALLLKSTIEASEMNVLINLKSISDESFVSDAKQKIDRSRQHLAELASVASRVTDNLA